MFKDLLKGSILYYIDNSDKLSVSNGSLVSISAPRFEQNNYNSTNRVLDLLVNINGKNINFTINENSTDIVFTPNGSILVSDKDNLIKQLKILKSTFENTISEIIKTKTKLEECNNYLENYDTEFKQKKEIETRITSIENKFLDFDNKLNTILNTIKPTN